MRWKCALAGWVALFWAAALITPAWAQATDGVRWQAEYWSNTTLAGAPAFTRTETAIDHNWGTGSPNPALIPDDRFSARWSGTLNAPAGRYRFTVVVDDGARLWVDERLLIDEWTVQSANTFQAEITLSGAAVPVRLEYFENTGDARIQLTWTRLDAPSPTPTPGTLGAPLNLWRGEYYNNTTLGGEPVLVRNDAEINFDWGTEAPAAGVNRDRFAVRWTRTLDLTPGRYQFTATVDDGARLWVNERLILDEWTVQSAQSFSAMVEVTGGAIPVRMEYFENTGVALARLTWSRTTNGTSTPVGAPTAQITGANFLNMRTGPSVNFGRITVIARGEVVELLGRRPGTPWVQIRLGDGQIGWVNSSYLTGNVPFIELPAVP